MARGRAGKAEPVKPSGRVIHETMREGATVRGEASAGRVIHETVTEAAGASDRPAIDLGAWVSTLFRRTMVQVEQHRSGDAHDRVDEDGACRELEAALSTIWAIGDATLRDAALTGIVAALSLGFHHRGAPGVVRRAREETSAEALDKMHEGRRVTVIRDIIDRHAQAWLKGHPEDEGNAAGIALSITASVAEEVQALAKIPNGWKAVPPLQNDDLKRYVENIYRKLIEDDGRMTAIHP